MSDIRNVTSTSQISKTSKLKKKSSTKNHKSDTPKKTEHFQLSALNNESLQKHIKKRIHSIDLNNTEELKKARRILIEDSLIWGLGEDVIEDPQFIQMVQNIELQFQQNKDQERKVDKLLKDLCS